MTPKSKNHVVSS
jgi:hypothetical protein